MSAAERLCAIVASYYGSDLAAMRVKHRSESVWLRAVAVQAAQRYPLISLMDLGRALGLDHSSVIYLRDLTHVSGQPIRLEADLLRLIAVDASPRAHRRICESCGGTGVVVVAA